MHPGSADLCTASIIVGSLKGSRQGGDRRRQCRGMTDLIREGVTAQLALTSSADTCRAGIALEDGQGLSHGAEEGGAFQGGLCQQLAGRPHRVGCHL